MNHADILVTRACVGSGFCCKKAPCEFGAPDPVTRACIYLEEWPGNDLGVTRYRCGRYEFIVADPSGSRGSPAFGAGCCSPLFNGNRDRISLALVKRHLRLYDTAPGTPIGVLSGFIKDDALSRLYPWALKVERFDMDRIAGRVVFSPPRSEWSSGPWQEEPDLVEWRLGGVSYPLLIVRGEAGVLCGFVGVPETHPLHGTFLRDDATLTSPDLPEVISATRPCGQVFIPTNEPPTCWWLGFHCGSDREFVPAMPPEAQPSRHYAHLSEVRERVETLARALTAIGFEVPLSREPHR